MSAFTRVSIVAIPSWLLWTAIIVRAAPEQPVGMERSVFFVSMALALLGCLWACWNALPRYASSAWHRPLNVGIGIAAFVILMLIGHTLGVALAAQLAAR